MHDHSSHSPVVIYVSPVFGDDAWTGATPAPNVDGTDGPLASLQAARDRLRERPAGTAATVYLRGGQYPLAMPLDFTAADGGSPDAPVIWRNYRDETPVIVGGRVLTPADLQPVSDPAVLQRLTPAAREHVRVVKLADAGVFQSRGFGRPVVPAPPEVFAGDRRLQVARWPKDGYLQIADMPAETQSTDEHGNTIGALASGFVVAEDRPFAWASSASIWAYGFWHWDWADSYLGVAALNADSRCLTIREPERPPGSTKGFRIGQRYCFYNVLDELSAPGEYVIDQDAGLLYVWLPEMPLGALPAVSTLSDAMIRLQGVSDLELRGLTVTVSRGDGITIRDGARCRVDACHLHNLGNRAVIIAGGLDHVVQRCHIHDTGDGGIAMHGGDRPTLTPGGHEIADCHIHDFSIWSRTYRPAVQMNGVGLSVHHCHIHDAPHSAIIFQGNDHVLSHNHIHHVCTDTGDCGAIYTGRDYTSRGTVIRHNILTDVTGPGLWGSNGIYLDDNASGIDIIGNLFLRVPRAAFIGGGMDIEVVGNIMVDCEQAIHVDGRGLAPGLWQDQIHKTMKERYIALRANEPPYVTRYPELLRVLPYFESGEPVPPLADRIADNIICRCPDWLDVRWFARVDHLDIGRHWVVDDSVFVAAARGDFSLPADSPILRAGFEPLPLAEIGIRQG